jgi:hypothetical protein
VVGPSYFGSDFALSDNRGMAVAPDGTVFLSGLGHCGALGGAAVLKSTDGVRASRRYVLTLLQLASVVSKWPLLAPAWSTS